MFKKILKTFVLLLILSACTESNSNTVKTTVQTKNGEIVYNLETALTHEEMARGLMNRKTLAKDSGMIFNIGGESGIAMWMKDTYIALDMLFLNDKGEIIALYENAEPQSTKLIRPQTDQPIQTVIELNAGEISARGMAVGDIVLYQLPTTK